MNSILKKTAFISLFLVTAITAYAQQHSEKELLGRWRSHHGRNIGDLLFLGDGKAAFLSPNGLLYGYVHYSLNFKDQIIGLKYTMDINRKSGPYYMYAEIKFLHDSTFLYQTGNKITDKTDTTTKNIRVYKKVVPEKPGTELHRPTYTNLLGTWTDYFKGELLDDHIVFIDSNRVIFRKKANIEELTYKVDFARQPITIDFYYPNSPKTLQAFLLFLEEDLLRIEFFPNNNRGDHLTVLGRNMSYKKEAQK